MMRKCVTWPWRETHSGTSGGGELSVWRMRKRTSWVGKEGRANLGKILEAIEWSLGFSLRATATGGGF